MIQREARGNADSIVNLFVANLGGTWPVVFWLTFCGGLLFSEVSQSLQTWFMGYWAQQYEHGNPSDVEVGL